jgi:hypothetical protein
MAEKRAHLNVQLSLHACFDIVNTVEYLLSGMSEHRKHPNNVITTDDLLQYIRKLFILNIRAWPAPEKSLIRNWSSPGIPDKRSSTVFNRI